MTTAKKEVLKRMSTKSLLAKAEALNREARRFEDMAFQVNRLIARRIYPQLGPL